jgi:plastocyanin
MSVRILLIFLCLAAVPFAGLARPASAGEMTGVISINGHPAPGAVVYLTESGNEGPDSAPGQHTIRQEGLEFHPPFSVVPVGSMIVFENHDHEIHNVKSRARGNRFDLGGHMPGTVKTVVLNTPGPVSLTCRIHDQMKAVILVVPGAIFALSDSEGRFDLGGMEPGRHRLEVWHPQLSPAEVTGSGRDVKVGSARLEVDFEIDARAYAGSDRTALSEIEDRDWLEVVAKIEKALDQAIDRWRAGKKRSAMRMVLTAHSRLFGETGFSRMIEETAGDDRVTLHNRRFNEIVRRIQSEEVGEEGIIAEKSRLLEALKEDIRRFSGMP